MSLSIINLRKTFGKKEIFDAVSYSFADKGIYIIKGDSGIGKTTLLRIIAGFDTKIDGQVIGGGFENVSFAFQEYRLFPNLTALQNITEAVWEKPTAECEKEAKTML